MTAIITRVTAIRLVLVSLAVGVMLAASSGLSDARAAALPVATSRGALAPGDALTSPVYYRGPYRGDRGWNGRPGGYKAYRPHGYRPYGYRPAYRPNYRPVYRPYGYSRPYRYGYYGGGPRCRLVTVRSFDPYWGGSRVRTVRRCW